MFNDDGRTDTHNEGNSRISEFCDNAYKKTTFCSHSYFVWILEKRVFPYEALTDCFYNSDEVCLLRGTDQY